MKGKSGEIFLEKNRGVWLEEKLAGFWEWVKGVWRRD